MRSKSEPEAEIAAKAWALQRQPPDVTAGILRVERPRNLSPGSGMTAANAGKTMPAPNLDLPWQPKCH